MVMMALEGLERVLQVEESRESARGAAGLHSANDLDDDGTGGGGGRPPSPLVSASIIEKALDGHNSTAVTKRASRIWKQHFVSCALCRQSFSRHRPADARFCNECKCHVCSNCDCQVYHLSYQEELWAAEGEKDDGKKKAKKSKKQKKKAKMKEKKKNKATEDEEKAKQAEKEMPQETIGGQHTEEKKPKKGRDQQMLNFMARSRSSTIASNSDSCSAGGDKEIGVARFGGGNARKGSRGTRASPPITVVASSASTYTTPLSVGVGPSKSKQLSLSANAPSLPEDAAAIVNTTGDKRRGKGSANSTTGVRAGTGASTGTSTVPAVGDTSSLSSSGIKKGKKKNKAAGVFEEANGTSSHIAGEVDVMGIGGGGVASGVGSFNQPDVDFVKYLEQTGSIIALAKLMDAMDHDYGGSEGMLNEEIDAEVQMLSRQYGHEQQHHHRHQRNVVGGQ